MADSSLNVFAEATLAATWDSTSQLSTLNEISSLNMLEALYGVEDSWLDGAMEGLASGPTDALQQENLIATTLWGEMNQIVNGSPSTGPYVTSRPDIGGSYDSQGDYTYSIDAGDYAYYSNGPTIYPRGYIPVYAPSSGGTPVLTSAESEVDDLTDSLPASVFDEVDASVNANEDFLSGFYDDLNDGVSVDTDGDDNITDTVDNTTSANGVPEVVVVASPNVDPDPSAAANDKFSSADIIGIAGTVVGVGVSAVGLALTLAGIGGVGLAVGIFALGLGIAAFGLIAIFAPHMGGGHH